MQTAADIYPSRNRSVPEICDRRDPVVYGRLNASGPLSSRQLRDYERDGYLFFEGLFSEEEVSEYLAEAGRLCAHPAIGRSPLVILEPESHEVRSVFAVHRLSAIFATLISDPRVLDAVTQILGGEVYIHQSRLNLKPGFEGKEFYWHSDFETWHVEDGMPRMRALSCSLALTENMEFNGPLMVVPGSHHSYVSCVGRTPDNHYQTSLQRQIYGVPDRVSLTRLAKAGGIAAPKGPAGSLLLFECNLMHGSAGNISPYPRSNVFFVFNSIENRLVQPFNGLSPRPRFLASRRFTPVKAPNAIA